MAHAVEQGQDRAEPAVLGASTGNPVDRVVGSQRARCGVRVGGLGIVHIKDARYAGNGFLAMGQPGIKGQLFRDIAGRQFHDPGDRIAGCRILPVVRAGQCDHGA